MKPRLKLLNDGSLTLVAPGLTGNSPLATRRLIWRHYGSLAAFARRFNLRYDIVCAATAARTVNTGSKVAHVKAMLGLPARQSRREERRQNSKAQIAAALAPYARLQCEPIAAARTPYARPPAKSSAPEAPEAQSASAKAGRAGTPTEVRV